MQCDKSVLCASTSRLLGLQFYWVREQQVSLDRLYAVSLAVPLPRVCRIWNP